MNIRNFCFSVFLFCLLLSSAETKAQYGSGIIDTSQQMYSYSQMLEDLELLQENYPSCIRYELTGSTYQGRKIPVVYFGDSTAAKHIMIQASMHAREYMSTQLVMKMLEFYASRYDAGYYKQHSFRDLFEKVNLVIIPMVNPDGVEIAQKGEEGALTDDVKQWIRENTEAGTHYDQIKANARGVDINRNFRNGFGKGKNAQNKKNYTFYCGEYPFSEPETQLMLDVSKKYDYHCFLNYHTSGNVIFHGCMNALQSVNAKAQKIATLIKQRTGYPCFGPKTAPPSGTWADDVEVLYQRPSVTIEIGSKNPVPISEFNSIYNKNLWIWADIIYSIINQTL